MLNFPKLWHNNGENATYFGVMNTDHAGVEAKWDACHWAIQFSVIIQHLQEPNKHQEYAYTMHSEHKSIDTFQLTLIKIQNNVKNHILVTFFPFVFCTIYSKE